MEEIAAAGFAESMAGFKLAGIRIVAECSEKNADERVNALMEREGVGLVILERPLLSFVTLKTRKRIEASTHPVVITIPGKGGGAVTAEEQGESMSVMIKRAIGVELKIK